MQIQKVRPRKPIPKLEADGRAEPEPGQKELYASWSLFILITLLIVALFTSYMLQTRKIQAVHETVLSIFAGKIGGQEWLNPVADI